MEIVKRSASMAIINDLVQGESKKKKMGILITAIVTGVFAFVIAALYLARYASAANW